MVPMMNAALVFAIVCVREPSVSAEMVETRRVGHFPHVGEAANAHEFRQRGDISF
jgi:hypothetical protein